MQTHSVTVFKKFQQKWKRLLNTCLEYKGPQQRTGFWCTEHLLSIPYGIYLQHFLWLICGRLLSVFLSQPLFYGSIVVCHLMLTFVTFQHPAAQSLWLHHPGRPGCCPAPLLFFPVHIRNGMTFTWSLRMKPGGLKRNWFRWIFVPELSYFSCLLSSCFHSSFSCCGVFDCLPPAIWILFIIYFFYISYS